MGVDGAGTVDRIATDVQISLSFLLTRRGAGGMRGRGGMRDSHAPPPFFLRPKQKSLAKSIFPSNLFSSIRQGMKLKG